MDAALSSIQDRKKLIDDILTYDTCFSEHAVNVQKLLQSCNIDGISIYQRKFVFASKEEKYVGFIMNGNKVRQIQTRLGRSVSFLNQQISRNFVRSRV